MQQQGTLDGERRHEQVDDLARVYRAADDLPKLGDEFERMALESAPQLSPQDPRLGALYIRKSRFLPKKEQSLLAKLGLATIDHESTAPVTLAKVKCGNLPDAPGLIELREETR